MAIPAHLRVPARLLRETPARGLVKAVSWRLVGSLGTAALVLLFTHRWNLALAVGSLEAIAKIIAFYLHERAWDRISFGRA